jgi:3-phenylpropionate/trans-cinnamate dioxygenase ferredoxin reductase component
MAGAEVTVLEEVELPLLRVLGSRVATVFAEVHTAHGVFCAAGDVANTYHPLLGRRLRVETLGQRPEPARRRREDDARCARHL